MRDTNFLFFCHRSHTLARRDLIVGGGQWVLWLWREEDSILVDGFIWEGLWRYSVLVVYFIGEGLWLVGGYMHVCGRRIFFCQRSHLLARRELID